MDKDNPSIEDLLINDQNTENKQDILAHKIKDILIKDKEKETAEQAGILGLPYINLVGFAITPEALILIPQTQAKKEKLICFYNDDRSLRFATTQPDNHEALALIEHITTSQHASSELYLISEKSFSSAFALYDRLPQIKEIKTGIDVSENDLLKWQAEISNFSALQKTISEASLTDVVTIIIASALKSEASDIHIEAEEKDVKIRFRIDGMLHTVATLPINLWRRIISRIKLLAHLKLNVDAVPQDGRYTINLTQDKVDVRVSTVPTAYGESVVMRLLRSSSVGLKFEDLGIRGRAYEILQQEIQKPNGMIITTGPTGSGKTTTLYAALNKLNTEDTKIITLEDPIEYKLEGINQSQIDHAKNYTFAKGLRSILRQDPDIVMVGEIRDEETAEIAVNAALTGHLVISTLHTNSAAGTIPRFLAMKVQPFLLAPAVNAIIGQRLVRKLCVHCKQSAKLDTETLAKVNKILSSLPAGREELQKINLEKLEFYSAPGCEKCNNLGYRGRIGIYEVMLMDEQIEKITLSGQATEFKLQEIAQKAGMITMVQDGLLKALEGITSVDEVFKKAE
jgi:type IV pilus assembly protein PilB